MPLLELYLWASTLGCLGVGIWGICWVRRSGRASKVARGRRLFLTALVFLGVTVLVAAFHRAEGLAPQGLTAGMLLIGMLWESPFPAL